MPDLWLLRHGTAEEHGARSDDERDLTDRGEEQARAAGRALHRADLAFDVLLSSPKVRAWRTAELAGVPLGLEPVRHDDVVGLDGDEARTLAGLAEGRGRVLVVGHEPDLSDTIRALTGARVRLRKGGVAGVRLDGDAQLVCLMGPRELRMLGRD